MIRQRYEPRAHVIATRHAPIFFHCLLPIKRYSLALLIGVLALTFVPRATQAQSVSCAQTLVMARGQTLATIAARTFGTQDGVAAIIAATNTLAALDASYTPIADPNAVEAGWKICVPTTVGNRASSKGKMEIAAVALEQNEALLTATLAARRADDDVYPLTIEYLRRQEYPAVSLTIEATLPAGDHNISAGFEDAMRRSLEFLDAQVKNLSPAMAQLQTASTAQLVP